MRHSLDYVWNYLRELGTAWLPAGLLGSLSWVGTLFGMPHVGTGLVLGLTVVDWIAGVYLARLTKTLSYTRARKGITKTAVWFGVLIIAAWLRSSPNEKVLVLFSEWLVFGMVYTELLSVMKNLRAIGTARTWDVSALATLEGHIRKFDPTRVLPGARKSDAVPEEPAAEEVPKVQTRFSLSTLTTEVDGKSQEMAVVAVVGELDLHNARELRDRVKEPLAAYGRLRVDLSGVKYCDSSGTGALLGIMADAREAGHPLDVVTMWHPQPQLSRVLNMTGLDKVLNVVRVEGDRYAK